MKQKTTPRDYRVVIALIAFTLFALVLLAALLAPAQFRCCPRCPHWSSYCVSH